MYQFKVQKCNPHRFTLNQHIFPRKSISRFNNEKGMVEVFHKKSQKTLMLQPKNKLFCAKRIWDQRSEIGYMKEIEDNFQFLVSKVLGEVNYTLNDTDNRTVLLFLALWDLRHSYYRSPIKDIELVGVHPGDTLTKDEEEILEANGYIVCSSNDSTAFQIGSRFIAGRNLEIGIHQKWSAHKDMKWGIVRSVDGEFVVPDTFSDFAIVPVSPQVLLLGNSEDILIVREEVAIINRLAKSTSINYYFAKNLHQCPV